MRKIIALLPLILCSACSSMHDHQSMNPADDALTDSMKKMHKDMRVEMTGDPDKDFVAMMIPHHEGAIEMAKAELKYGRDPKVRRLAQNIVNAQAREIGFMRHWQKNN